jgi:dienelactone hydrolase
MKEKPFLFGEHKSMLGIWTEPPSPAMAAGRPAVILLNAGVVHRIGPYRKSVKIARRLAAEGFLVMRFDLAGIGDSEPRRDALSFEEGAISDVKEAMDHLQKTRHIDKFVLMGLCSGADNSYQTTYRDPRVVGALMMDGYSYRTPEFHARYFVKRARKVPSWRALAGRKLKALERRVRDYLDRAKDDGSGGEEEPPIAQGEPVRQYVREFPPKERLASEMLELVGRGVRLHFVYSSGMREYYNYERQFMDSFRGVDFKGMVTSEFFAEADHTFTEIKSQEDLVDAIVRWMLRAFPPAGSGAGTRDAA